MTHKLYVGLELCGHKLAFVVSVAEDGMGNKSHRFVCVPKGCVKHLGAPIVSPVSSPQLYDEFSKALRKLIDTTPRPTSEVREGCAEPVGGRVQ